MMNKLLVKPHLISRHRYIQCTYVISIVIQEQSSICNVKQKQVVQIIIIFCIHVTLQLQIRYNPKKILNMTVVIIVFSLFLYRFHFVCIKFKKGTLQSAVLTGNYNFVCEFLLKCMEPWFTQASKSPWKIAISLYM